MKIVIIVCLAALVSSSPTSLNDKVEDVEMMMLRKMEELKKTHSLRIYGDIVTLEKIDGEGEQRARPDEDPLVASIDRFFNSRKIQIRLPNDGSPADFLGRAIGQKMIDIELSRLTHGASEGERNLEQRFLVGCKRIKGLEKKAC